MQPSNTPPDGDFVRYLEKLTADQGVAKKTPAVAAPKAMPRLPSAAAAGLKSGMGISFVRHAKWAIGLYVATQILGSFVPGAGFLFVPVLAAYVVWLVYRFRSQPPSAFVKKMTALARRAAEESPKASSTFPKNKP